MIYLFKLHQFCLRRNRAFNIPFYVRLKLKCPLQSLEMGTNATLFSIICDQRSLPSQFNNNAKASALIQLYFRKILSQNFQLGDVRPAYVMNGKMF